MWRSVVGARILECDGLTSLSRTKRTRPLGRTASSGSLKTRNQRIANALAMTGQRQVFDGDKSPAESAAKSAHSKASGRDRHFLSHRPFPSCLSFLLIRLTCRHADLRISL
jgi:hypothetical protein